MPEMKLPLTARAIAELKVPHNPQVSPDGKRIVFEVSEADFEESRYITRLWIADTAEGKPRQITFSYEGDHAPKWSPDGRTIAFLSSRPDMTEPPPPEEDEDALKDQIWLLPADGGEAYRLTNAKEGISGYEWTPDSLSILYLTSEARPQPLQFVHDDTRKRKIDPTIEPPERLRKQFWEVEIEKRDPELVYTGDFGVAEFAVSPDGNRLVFNSNGTGDPNDYPLYDLFVLELEGEEDPRKLVERPGGKFAPQWSPDGARIAFLAALDPALSYSQECAWTVSAQGGVPENLFSSAPYDAHELLWPRGDETLYALVADRTRRPVVAIRPDGVEQMTTAAAVDSLDFHVQAGVVAVVSEDSSSPPELYVLGEGGPRAITEFGKAFLERYALPRQETIRWQSDEWEIEGLVTYPPGFDPEAASGPLPLVVQVHGGPKSAATDCLRSYNQHSAWAAEGYLVFRPNFRGSEGYGNDFAVANRRDLGGGDFRDVMRGVDYLVERGLADPERIGIMGGSYGGYMTNWAIGQTDRFRAGISMFGIFNLVTDYSNSELSRWDPEYMGAYYWEDPEVYRQCSPSTHLEKINTPVLILHGDGDANTSISNSREMYQALKARGVPVQFVHYPREGHGLREPAHRLDEMRRCLAWFDRYLKGSGETQTAYRLGDKVLHEDYEIHLVRVGEGEYQTRSEDAEDRLLEVAFSLASTVPVESGWDFALAEVRLVGPGGADCPLRGVPTDFGGGRALVEAADMVISVHPNRDSGRLSVAPMLTFEIPEAGGDFELRIVDFPPFRFTVGPKPEKDIEDAGEAPPAHPSSGSAPSESEAPVQVPTRRRSSLPARRRPN